MENMTLNITQEQLDKCIEQEQIQLNTEYEIEQNFRENGGFYE